MQCLWHIISDHASKRKVPVLLGIIKVYAPMLKEHSKLISCCTELNLQKLHFLHYLSRSIMVSTVNACNCILSTFLIFFFLLCQSSKGMRSSKFCLNPAGDTPSSCRLFDAIVSHCVPVIISDQIELPFENEIDYSQFSIFFSFKEALEPGYMVNQLRKFPKERWIEMWKRLKDISHHYEFQYPPKKEDAVNMLWRQVKHKLPGVKLAVHRSRRLKVPDWWRRR